MGFFERLKEGLSKTKKGFVEKVESIFSGRQVDEQTLEELEETLILSDVGGNNAAEIVGHLKEKADRGEMREASSVKDFLKKEMVSMLGRPQNVVVFGEKPFVILAIGVNGVGKTTTIGKLASRFREQGYSVILAAGDTFRAAAIEQLEIWAGRSGVQLVKHQSGSDPSAVVFDAIEAAKARGIDVVIIDTAGRLHTKSPLMEELKKVKRVCGKAMAGAPHEILLVVDATNGQNALRQAQMFNEAIGVTGIALTKLDGTAKGGIVFAIKKELNIPVKLIGVGEGIEDLQDFVPEDFVRALFE
ncbi:Signal recognition particle receptor FtsY [Candidatus Sulfobium mesophilum]|uniref:Signal recognition particle receptor FtsY n=1 Tax=Candidatus Sulfobium mesophilum TaxID=2016548 RepID=A0A2U3QF68_9BACT|nr:Signal recognition particle receptor FtsY [Candidatus Sulfobium mesophilum]